MCMSRLPPGQIETRRFPVVGEREPSGLASPDVWSLGVGGMVQHPFTISLEELLSLDQAEVTFDIHCVTSWTRLDSTFMGVPLSRLLERAGVVEGAEYVSFSAYSERGHHTSLPLHVANEASWLAHSFAGERLAVEHGGPVRVVTPGRYFYKSLKWVRELVVLAEDRPGWWETNSSYHNNADPWTGDQRFTTGSIRPEQLERLRSASSYHKYRGRVMLGLDLRGWEPRSLDLQRLYLKGCDLRNARLGGADMRASNLSLSNLSAADLRQADLSGADLEGADFSDADLAGADLTGTALSATRFDGARVEGTVFDGCWGLVESQQRYLISRGIDLGS